MDWDEVVYLEDLGLSYIKDGFDDVLYLSDFISYVIDGFPFVIYLGDLLNASTLDDRPLGTLLSDFLLNQYTEDDRSSLQYFGNPTVSLLRLGFPEGLQHPGG
jgi:hypothetical protein